jgi:hypothetical protein
MITEEIKAFMEANRCASVRGYCVIALRYALPQLPYRIQPKDLDGIGEIPLPCIAVCPTDCADFDEQERLLGIYDPELPGDVFYYYRVVAE